MKIWSKRRMKVRENFQIYLKIYLRIANLNSNMIGLRQGRSIEDTNKLIEAGMIMSKVGAIDTAEATEKLTSTLNGFKLGVEDAMHVVDAYSAVDLKAATSVDELAEAMSRTSNIANDMGVSFEQMVG